MKYNANNKYRRTAIDILTYIDNHIEYDLCGLQYYELEDAITNIIKNNDKNNKL
jgi:hypothetical protein